jgi:hypothetical protein
MSDSPVGLRHAHDLSCSKSLFVELDGLGGTLDDQIRRSGVTSLGNRLGLAHNLTLLPHGIASALQAGSCGAARRKTELATGCSFGGLLTTVSNGQCTN